MPEEALTPLETFILSGLAERSRYGYELVERIEELSEGRVDIRPGNLYRVLHRLNEQGLVSEVEPPDDAADARRQYYGLTPEGRARVARELSMYAGVLARLTERAHLTRLADA